MAWARRAGVSTGRSASMHETAAGLRRPARTPPEAQVLARVAARQVAQHIVVVVPAGRAVQERRSEGVLRAAQGRHSQHHLACHRCLALPSAAWQQPSGSQRQRRHALDDAQDEVRGGHPLGALRLLKLAQLLHKPVHIVCGTASMGRRARLAQPGNSRWPPRCAGSPAACTPSTREGRPLLEAAGCSR